VFMLCAFKHAVGRKTARHVAARGTSMPPREAFECKMTPTQLPRRSSGAVLGGAAVVAACLFCASTHGPGPWLGGRSFEASQGIHSVARLDRSSSSPTSSSSSARRRQRPIPVLCLLRRRRAPALHERAPARASLLPVTSLRPPVPPPPTCNRRPHRRTPLIIASASDGGRL
jgi:hypothetical protein